MKPKHYALSNIRQRIARQIFGQMSMDVQLEPAAGQVYKTANYWTNSQTDERQIGQNLHQTREMLAEIYHRCFLQPAIHQASAEGEIVKEHTAVESF